MPHKYCSQCKKRLSDKTEKLFCSSECENIYIKSDFVYCKNCNLNLGKSSVIKKSFCGNKCINEHQKKINQIKRVCINCNQEFLIQKSSHRYKLCSLKCQQEYISSSERNDKRMKSLSENNMKKYGVEFTLSLKNVIDKSKQTKLDRYGSENYNNRKKANDTCLEKYGTNHILNIKEFSDKSKQTKLDRYGTLNFNDKSNITKLEKYGTLNFTDKSNITKLEKYGTLNFTDKASNTCLERYGIKNPFLLTLEENKEKQRKIYIDYLFDGNRLNGKVIPCFKKEEYINNKYETKYKFECNTCNTIFSDTLYSGHIPRCPVCYPSSISKPQMEIFEYLKSLLPINTDILQNVRHQIHPLELDIYIPSLKLAIEYNGMYWHGEMNGGKDRNYHINKTRECEKLGIRLIHIFEDEWFDKQIIIKNKINHLLNHLLKINNTKSIYGRRCHVKEISYTDSNDFLEKHHLQGGNNSSIQIGAFYNNKLVSVMTFGKQRIALGNKPKKDEYEMYRFCVGGENVVGIGGKLLNYFIKNYSPKRIVSYADRRWSNSNSFYQRLSFNFLRYTLQNYWYFDKSGIRFHRFGFRKSELVKKLKTYDLNLTEWQNMQLNGYDRIWDCGNLKYEWVNPN